MFKVIFVSLSFLLTACSSFHVFTPQGPITIKKPKPFCDIKKVDPNCKIEQKVQ